MTKVELRPATAADSEYCYSVHRLAMRSSVEAIWGWDEAVQRELHERGFDPAAGRIIVVDGRDAGFLRVDDRPGDIYLGRIELHPDHQGRGIGTTLIQQLIARAGDKAVLLDVLYVNRRAYLLMSGSAFARSADMAPATSRFACATSARATVDHPVQAYARGARGAKEVGNRSRRRVSHHHFEQNRFVESAGTQRRADRLEVDEALSRQEVIDKRRRSVGKMDGDDSIAQLGKEIQWARPVDLIVRGVVAEPEHGRIEVGQKPA